MMTNNEKQELMEIADRCISSDRDVEAYGSQFSDCFETLLDFCDVGYGDKPEYFDTVFNYDNAISDILIEEYISFASGVGGSTSDFAARIIINGLDSIEAYLIPDDIDGIMDIIREPIQDHALSPNREFTRLSDAGIC